MIDIKNLQEMKKLGRIIAEAIPNKITIALSGDLGAGKTTLSQEIIKSLGVVDTVTSPTFTIVNQYKSGIKTINHMDFYRINYEEELEDTGYFQYLKNSINLIEWWDKFPESMPKKYLKIHISYVDMESRTVEISSQGEEYEKLAKEIEEKYKEN